MEMKTILVLFAALFFIVSASAGCLVFPMPDENGQHITIHFYQKKPDFLKNFKDLARDRVKGKCHKTFLDYLEDENYKFSSELEQKKVNFSYLIDEQYSPIHHKKKFFKKLEELKEKRKFQIKRSEENGLLKIEVTQ